MQKLPLQLLQQLRCLHLQLLLMAVLRMQLLRALHQLRLVLLRIRHLQVEVKQHALLL